MIGFGGSSRINTFSILLENKWVRKPIELSVRKLQMGRARLRKTS